MCCAKVAKDSNPSHGQIKLATDWEIIFVMLFPPTLFIDFVDLDCLLPFFPAITTASSLLSNTIPQLAPSIDDRDCWCAKLIFFFYMEQQLAPSIEDRDPMHKVTRRTPLSPTSTSTMTTRSTRSIPTLPPICSFFAVVQNSSPQEQELW